MKYKKEFLSELENELSNRKIDSSEVIEYYDELIDDRVSNGKTEKTVVKNLGNIDDIIKDIEIEQQVDRAVKKPTVSNGVKALIAVLGVLSLPVLIPLVIVVIVLIITFGILILSLIISLVAVIVSLIAAVVGLFVGVFTGYVPVILLVFCLGVMLIVVPLCFEAIRGLIFIFRKAITGSASLLRKKQSQKGEKQ